MASYGIIVFILYRGCVVAKVWTAPVTAVGASVTVDDVDLINFPHVYVSFAYYDGADVSTRNPVVPTAGSIAVSGRVKGAQEYSSFPDSPVDATDVGDSANAGAPFNSIKASPTGVLTATHYVMTITGNES